MKHLLTAALIATALASPGIAQEIDNCAAETRQGFPTRMLVRCDITNTYDVAIAEISFAISSKSENRSVPWTDTINRLSISGGIEPNETISELVVVESLPRRAIDELEEIKWTAIAIEAWDPNGLPLMNPLQPLTDTTRQEIISVIRGCFNIGVLSQDALRESVDLQFRINDLGRAEAPSIEALNIVFTPAKTQLFEAARRAIIRCGATGFGVAGPFDLAIRFSPYGSPMISFIED